MAGVIRRLDPLVSSQIAAGEVIERPASVVKELVENSLDAGARHIAIDFEESGLSLIRVSDDGMGMSPEDAPVALERFATSKIASLADLDRIATLGFRGEALPSIAACSRLTLETKPASGDFGIAVKCDGGSVVSIEEKGLPDGTTVTVEDLFFNTPARLKFVKSRTSERQAIVDVVERLALAWPEVSFLLRSGGNVILRTSGGGLANAVADIFGPKDAGAMVKVQSERGVEGFVGLPSLYRRYRDRQMFSVNRRPVRNAALGWALDSAFEGLLPPKSYPVCVLNLAMPPEEVDVNAHPTKAEVRFRNEGEVRSRVVSGVREALSKAGFGTWGRSAEANAQVFRRTPEHSPARPTPEASPGGPHGTAADVRWGLLRDGPPPRPTDREVAALGPNEDADLPPGWRYLGSIADTYLVAATPSSLLIIDKHALMESLAFRKLEDRQGGSQDLLMAEVLHLSPEESMAYDEYGSAIEEVGFDSRKVGERTVLVTRVPLILGRPMEPLSLKEVLAALSHAERARHSADFGDGPGPLSRDVRALERARLQTAACHASVRAREPLSQEEACGLLRELFMHPEARACPHGRPTVKEVPLDGLAEFFGRKYER